MRKRFKYPLYAVGFITAFFILIFVCYFFYDKFIDDKAVVIADEELSINFINGNNFNQRHNKELKFTIINNSETDVYYYIRFSNIIGTTKYHLVCEDNNIDMTQDLSSGVVSSYILINGGSTQSYVLKFEKNGNYSGTINVGKETSGDKTLADVLLDKGISNETKTKLGTSAVSNEGLIESTDDLGTTYYFRGKVDNNYVSFANLMWRVVRINGDGSVRLILNDVLDHNTPYYSDEFHFEESLIRKELNTFYDDNLKKYDGIVATTNYCDDLINTQNDNEGYDRIVVDNIFTFNCIGEKVSSTIGLLTIDEAIFAGASLDGENTSYYLYNSKIGSDYATMSFAKRSGDYYPFVISKGGTVLSGVSGKFNVGIRPVINIVKNVSVSGEGTIKNPYTVSLVDSD